MIRLLLWPLWFVMVLFSSIWLYFFMDTRVRIQFLNEQEEWEDYKVFPVSDGDWSHAVKETYELNVAFDGEPIVSKWSGPINHRYRALVNCGDGLTHIYCSGFSVVPTMRSW